MQETTVYGRVTDIRSRFTDEPTYRAELTKILHNHKNKINRLCKRYAIKPVKLQPKKSSLSIIKRLEEVIDKPALTENVRKILADFERWYESPEERKAV